MPPEGIPIPDRSKSTPGPLDLTLEEASKIEGAILALEPFGDQSWEIAIENYLILRWVLGLGTATAKEIVEGLGRAQFSKMANRPEKSVLGTVYRVLRGNKFRDFRAADSERRSERRSRSGRGPRREQYVWRSNSRRAP